MTNTLDNRIAVIGMGIAGFVTAIEAAKRDKKVSLFEKRTAHSRTQRVVLTKENADYLVKESYAAQKVLALNSAFPNPMCESIVDLSILINTTKGALLPPNRFSSEAEYKSYFKGEVEELLKIILKDGDDDEDKTLDKIFEEAGITPGGAEAKAIESDITILLGLQYNNNQIQINHMQKLLNNRVMHDESISEHIEVHADDSLKLEAIETDKHKLNYSDSSGNHEINFAHLVDTTGTSHVTSSLLKDFVGQNGRTLEHGDLVEQPRHQMSGTVHLKVQDGTEVNLGGRELRKSDLSTLEAVGWNKPYLPEVYIWSDESGRKVYIAGEVPEAYRGLRGKDASDAMTAWGKTLMGLTRGYASDSLSLDVKDPDAPKYRDNPDKQEAIRKKNKLRATVFPLVLDAGKFSLVELGDGSIVTQLGDASRSSDFRLGIGANHAMDDARCFVNSLGDDNSLNIAGLEAKFKDKVDGMRERTLDKNIDLETDEQAAFALSLEDNFTRLIATLPEHVRNSDSFRAMKDNLDKLIKEAEDAALEIVDIDLEAPDRMQDEMKAKNIASYSKICELYDFALGFADRIRLQHDSAVGSELDSLFHDGELLAPLHKNLLDLSAPIKPQIDMMAEHHHKIQSLHEARGNSHQIITMLKESRKYLSRMLEYNGLSAEGIKPNSTLSTENYSSCQGIAIYQSRAEIDRLQKLYTGVLDFLSDEERASLRKSLTALEEAHTSLEMLKVPKDPFDKAIYEAAIHDNHESFLVKNFQITSLIEKSATQISTLLNEKKSVLQIKIAEQRQVLATTAPADIHDVESTVSRYQAMYEYAAHSENTARFIKIGRSSYKSEIAADLTEERISSIAELKSNRDNLVERSREKLNEVISILESAIHNTERANTEIMSLCVDTEFVLPQEISNASHRAIGYLAALKDLLPPEHDSPLYDDYCLNITEKLSSFDRLSSQTHSELKFYTNNLLAHVKSQEGIIPLSSDIKELATSIQTENERLESTSTALKQQKIVQQLRGYFEKVGPICAKNKSVFSQSEMAEIREMYTSLQSKLNGLLYAQIPSPAKSKLYTSYIENLSENTQVFEDRAKVFCDAIIEIDNKIKGVLDSAGDPDDLLSFVDVKDIASLSDDIESLERAGLNC
jgi:hypothetical protein